MAAYDELKTLFSNPVLTDKVQAALVKAAYAEMTKPTPTAAAKAWAVGVLSDTEMEARKALKFVLAAAHQDTPNATPEQIAGATDGNVQAYVDVVVPILIDVRAGV